MIDTRVCFGRRCSPAIFNKWFHAELRFRSYNVLLWRFSCYLKSWNEWQSVMPELMQVVQRLGFSISYNKVLSPSQTLVFLGIELREVKHDMTFKLATFQISLPFNGKTGFCTIMQAFRLVFWVFMDKTYFLYDFGQQMLWGLDAGQVALPQPKCDCSIRFAFAQWPAGIASDNALNHWDPGEICDISLASF